MILCEKPLSMNAAEGEEMVAAVEKAGVPNTVWYNYRRVPAVTLAKQLIDEGRLGRIFHYRANFLQDWTISADLPQGGAGLWRLDVRAAGSGVTGDLLAHCIDTALWLNGPIKSVTAMTETFVKERKHTWNRARSSRWASTTPARSCAASPTARWRSSNRPATPAATRRCTRSRSTARTPRSPGTCTTCTGSATSTTATSRSCAAGDQIHVTDGDMPYMDKWWVPGLQIGYEHSFVHQVADFLDGLAKNKPTSPTFREALETQKVCDAVLASAKSGQWVEVA